MKKKLILLFFLSFFVYLNFRLSCQRGGGGGFYD